MMRKISLVILVVLAALMIVAGGCATAAGTTSQPPASMPALNGRSLADTSWVLVSYGDPAALKTVIPGTQPTLKFNSDTTRISGNGSVNSYGAGCVRTDNQIAFSPITATAMASVDPAINAQEHTYFQLLFKAQSVTVGTGTLTIDCDGGQVLNFITAASPSPIVPPAGTPAASQSSTSAGGTAPSTGYTVPVPPSSITIGTQTPGSPGTVTLTVTASPPTSK